MSPLEELIFKHRHCYFSFFIFHWRKSYLRVVRHYMYALLSIGIQTIVSYVVRGQLIPLNLLIAKNDSFSLSSFSSLKVIIEDRKNIARKKKDSLLHSPWEVKKLYGYQNHEFQFHCHVQIQVGNLSQRLICYHVVAESNTCQCVSIEGL